MGPVSKLPVIFAVIGLSLLIAAGWMYTKEHAFVASAARADGVVTRLVYRRSSGSHGSGAYYPEVRFTPDGARFPVTFVAHVGSKPASHHVGERIGVLYPPGAPDDARMDTLFSLYLGTFVCGLLGTIFGGIGGTWLWLRRRAAAIAEELRLTGRRIKAKVVRVEQRTNIRVNGRSPWRIVAEWREYEREPMRVFNSANIWFDPTPNVGETVEVLVDRYDPKRYLVDLEFLPKG